MPVFEQYFSELTVENKKNLLALFVVIKFFVVIGMISFLVLTIRRNAARQCHPTSDLLNELEQEDVQPKNTNEPPRPNDWEKDPDWWKKN